MTAASGEKRAGARPVQRTTVFFDGSCPLCHAEMDHYRRRDRHGRLAFVDVSRPDADLPTGLDPATAMSRFHVLSSDGRLVSGAAGFAELWRHAQGWRWAARLARIPAVLALLELGYRAFLNIRPALVRIFVGLRHAPATEPDRRGRDAGKPDGAPMP